jgi:hypothetical protein
VELRSGFTVEIALPQPSGIRSKPEGTSESALLTAISIAIQGRRRVTPKRSSSRTVGRGIEITEMNAHERDAAITFLTVWKRRRRRVLED